MNLANDPTVCGETGESCRTFCAECPVKQNEENFRQFATEQLNSRAEGWTKYGFDSLLETVLEISEPAEIGREHWTAKTEKLVRAWENQKFRMRRIDEENSKPSDK